MLRIGSGHDTHRLEPGDGLVIGGVAIPHIKQFVAHSDGDVLLHAVIDAILGALSWGDIGEWFPDTSAEFAGADSAELTQKVVAKMQADAWQVVNIDCTIFAQQPKLSRFKPAIQTSLARLLHVEPGQVSVKAKTGEKVGPIGREESIGAHVVVLLTQG